MAALSRIAGDVHKKIRIKQDDTIILSSNPIPGNEKAVYRIINELSAKGANVIFQDTHVSGHAREEEIKLIYALTKPKYAVPVHGEYHHLAAQQKIAEKMGIDPHDIFILQSGDVLEMNYDSAKVTGKVQAGRVMVDGLGVGDVGNIVLRDRQMLSENGIVIVTLTLESDTKQLLSGPEIITRGFVYVKEAEDLLENAREVVEEAVCKCLTYKNADWNKIKSVIRDSLGAYVWKHTQRRPMILPIIMEV